MPDDLKPPVKSGDDKLANKGPAVTPASSTNESDSANSPLSVTSLAQAMLELNRQARAHDFGVADPATFETAKGGRYRAPRGGVAGAPLVLQDAHGRELNEDGSLRFPESQHVDAYGRIL